MLKLRTLEMADSADYIVKQLETHQEMLKGDYLVGIIGQIRSLQAKLQLCPSSNNCALSRDVSANFLQQICKEVMGMFGTLLK